MATATGAQALDTIYLFRHADKAADWPKARELDAFHPLSRAGMDRAERLAERLAGAGIPNGPDPRTVDDPGEFFAAIRITHAGDKPRSSSGTATPSRGC